MCLSFYLLIKALSLYRFYDDCWGVLVGAVGDWLWLLGNGILIIVYLII